MDVDFIFIMSPETERKDEFFDIIREMNFRPPVLCDFNHEFESNNLLADNDLYNTFLVGKNNEIIVVGSPVYHNALWTFYKQRIQQLNEKYKKKES